MTKMTKSLARSVLTLTKSNIKAEIVISGVSLADVETVRDAFQQDLARKGQEPDTAVELCCLLVLHRPQIAAEETKSLVIDCVWQHIQTRLLAETDIHEYALQQVEDTSQRQKLIRVYSEARLHVMGERWPSYSALFQAQKNSHAKIHGVFGGQGNTRHYLDDLRETFLTYQPLIEDIWKPATTLLKDLATDERVFEQYPQGLDVETWTQSVVTQPANDYLVSAPVSFPLIGLLQLVKFKAICMSNGLSPEEFTHRFSGLAGHSQGIIVATAISTAKTWEEYRDATIKAVKILFWIGARSAQSFGRLPSQVDGFESNVPGTPSPMLSVSNVTRKELETSVFKLNDGLPTAYHAYLALVNTSQDFVVSGLTRTLDALSDIIMARKPAGARTTRFLPVSIPCHSPLLDEAARLIETDLEDVAFWAGSLGLQINGTTSGSSMGSNLASQDNLVPMLIRSITSDLVEWPNVAFVGATHIIDFGPGSTSGIGTLTHGNIVGAGTRVITAGKLTKPVDSEVGSLVELFSRSKLRWGSNWRLDQSPTVVKTPLGPFRRTKLSELLKVPPILVAGMTPTTTHPDFVAAIMQAGYHVEFAAGGYHNAESLRSALFQLRDLMPLGRKITMNVIYASPKAMSWQIPFVRQLRAEGFPLAGLTIGGGVPSLEVATEYITSLGLEHISFKPSSVESIRRVIEIAKKNAPFSVILQWTGGRGGGHHSVEDFHSPILETYAAIRECANIHLVAGSGFGCAEDVIPYFTGTWSLHHGKKSVMPFDGVLFGSRVMISAEAHTSRGAKAAIVAAEGVNDAQWPGTYRAPTGGVISVVSEMGEPIHVIATRGAQLWAELDKTVFALEKKKRPALLAKKRQYIISRLNSDFQRPWFGIKTDGTSCEIAEMTYFEVVKRLIDLMFVGKWIDHSYETFVQKFVQRVEDRVGTTDANVAQTLTSRHIPDIKLIESLILESSSTLICLEDEHYFFQLCRSPGLKPVPFIPAIDEHFETWFKKDSLWQSEALETVVDQDAGRTFILHGPVAARQTNIMDEPVADILNGIKQGVLDHLAGLELVDMTASESQVLKNLPLDFIRNPTLRLALQDPDFVWAATLLGSQSITQRGRTVQNPLRTLIESLTLERIDISSNTVSFFTDDHGSSVHLSFDGGQEIKLTIGTGVTSSKTPVEMVFRYVYNGVASFAPIEQVMENHNEQLSSFYRQLWCPNLQTKQHLTALKVVEEDFRVQESRVTAFKKAIAYHGESKVPLDYSIVIAWKAISQLLVERPTDLLNLVHLSNQYERYEDIGIDDEIHSKAKVSGIIVRDSGTELAVVCDLSRKGKPMVKIHSRFLVRGDGDPGLEPFYHETVGPYEVKLSSTTDIAVLASKDWFILDGGNHLDDLDLTDVTLRFEPELFVNNKSQKTTGKVSIVAETGELSFIGTINHSNDQKRGNIVTSYLSRHGKDLSISTQQQERTVHTSAFQAPKSNEAYSRASGDFNPIHTSKSFAQMAGLPGTITHGMYCSAIVRQKVENHICKGNAARLQSFHVDFTGMVLPNDALQLTIRQVGMTAGIELYQFEVQCGRTGEKVLKGSASVAAASTTICFTGQGSAAKGMGMDLYASSTIARAIWDRAEVYFLSQFGLSILDIVRNNPKESIVYFGGVKGRQLQRNYQSMLFEMPSKEPGKNREFVPMFPEIGANTTSFTHRSSTGLLLATQFSQPALALMEMAAFADMKAAGVVAQGHHFAGHSLGEYIALACSADFMQFESMLYLFFCRGMTMQSAVDRDAAGRSDYSMVAVDPSRVGKVFVQNESALPNLVTVLREKTGFFIEIVNLNVRGKQYVCAGDLRALDLLQRVCDDLKSNEYSNPEAQFADLVISHAGSIKIPAAEVQLSRGQATIPLTGIDVPFHSSYLRPRMEAFRSLLEECLDGDRLAPEKLIERYVPNVTGTPFRIDRTYFEEVLGITKSERIQRVLQDWESWVLKIDRERPLLAAAA